MPCASCIRVAGEAHLVGVTGAPGSGKSHACRRSRWRGARSSGRPVAVIAIDPSSPITGGAILGDRVRMQIHAGDRDVFIRSMASRGHSGGLAAALSRQRPCMDAVRLPADLHRDRRHGPERGRGRGDRRYDARCPGARDGRRGPGDQGRAARGGRHRRRQQVRPAGRRPGRRPSCARCSPLARSTTASAATARPKRPDVLLASAMTGAGVPELLAALDRRDDARRASGPAAVDAAALKRAEAQIGGILTERVWGRLRSAAAREFHRTDPEIGGHVRSGSVRRRRFLLRALNGSDPS